jgi:hypothetical protein
MKLCILAIAPDLENLPDVDAELAAIAADHVIVPDPPLVGYVTAHDIAHEVSRNPCDVILWMCHGDDTGLVLSDNEHIDSDLVIQFVRTSKANLCVLNACWSERLARRVFVACQIDVIYARKEVEDKRAALYMSALSDALANADTYAEAYQQAGSQSGTYKYLAVEMNNSSGQVQGLTTEIQRLSFAISANSELQVERNRLLQQQIDSMRLEVNELRRVVEALEAASKFMRNVPPTIPQHVIVAIYLSAMALIAGVMLLILRGA